MPSSIRFTS